MATYLVITCAVYIIRFLVACCNQYKNKPAKFVGQSETLTVWHARLFCTGIDRVQDEDVSATKPLLNAEGVECIFPTVNGDEGQDNGDELFIR